MKKIFLPLICMLSSSGLIYASDYRAEFGVARASVDESDHDLNLNLIGADFYFSPVDTSKGPLAEAAFLSQSSVLAVIIGAETGTLYEELDADRDIKSVLINYVIPDSHFILGMEKATDKSKREDKLGFGYQLDSEVETTALTFGKFTTESSSVQLSYIDVEITEKESFGSFADIYSFDFKVYDLGFKNVIENADGSYLGLQADILLYDMEGSSANEYQFSATFYPTTMLSLGAGIRYYDPENTSATQNYSIDVEYFIVESISIALALYKADDDSNEFDSKALALTARF